MAGCFVRGHYEDVKWSLLSPLYWILMSVAAWKGAIQLVTKPSYWEKTVHGFCTYEDEPTLNLSMSGAQVIDLPRLAREESVG